MTLSRLLDTRSPCPTFTSLAALRVAWLGCDAMTDETAVDIIDALKGQSAQLRQLLAHPLWIANGSVET